MPPAERIFVGNARYDSLVLNDVMFCFLAGRRSGMRYHEMVPGVATTVEVQARIVQGLERHRVRYGVIRADPGDVPSPEGGKTLDGFIQEKFATAETFGNYNVWRRRQERSWPRGSAWPSMAQVGPSRYFRRVSRLFGEPITITTARHPRTSGLC